MGEVVIGISGASGAIYGKRLAEVLSDMGKTVRLVVTDSGKITLKHECDTTPEAVAEGTGAILEDAKNVGAKSASGSAKIDAVVICPCSGTTIGKLAAGISDNLVTRSAIVALKERRKLIIVPRGPLRHGSPREHGQTFAVGHHRHPRFARVLQPPKEHRRHGGFHHRTYP